MIQKEPSATIKTRLPRIKDGKPAIETASWNIPSVYVESLIGYLHDIGLNPQRVVESKVIYEGKSGK